jgi:hypothetical protein
MRTLATAVHDGRNVRFRLNPQGKSDVAPPPAAQGNDEWGSEDPHSQLL